MMLCYSKDDRGQYVSVNPEFLSFIQAKTVDEILGKNDRELPWHAIAAPIMEHDSRVIKTTESHVFIEQAQIHHKTYLRRCYKSPLLGRSNRAIGITGLSVPLDPKTLIPLSAQQTLCLKELALGSGIKKIAKTLGLSPRTVEHYLSTLRNKLNCETRTELILQALARGLISPLGGSDPIF